MPAIELQFWRAYREEVEPRDAQHRAGVIAATVANTAGRRRDGRPWESAHFFPTLKPPARALSASEQLRAWESIARPEDDP